MTKTLTEQWRDGTLKTGSYYIRLITGIEKSDYFDGKKFCFWTDYEIEEVLAPVPSYRQLYGPNDGNIPVGLFTVLKIIERDIEQYQKIRHLTDLECGIKSQVVSLLKRLK